MAKINGIKKKPRTAMVAGGAGFLGSHLCDSLIASGRRVICIDSLLTGSEENLRQFDREPNFDLIVSDVTRPIPPALKADEIYNLACPASPPHYQADPVHTMLTSVLGAHKLLERARLCQARYVQASTSEIYGDPEQHPQREDYCGNVNTTGPRACYDEGKRAAEALCYDFRRAETDVRVARIFNTYGPRMRADDGRIVSNFVTQALSGEPITVYGDGRQTRSFCYVSDMVAGLEALMNVPEAPDTPINLGNPGEFSVGELASKVLEMTGSASTLSYRPLPTDDPRRRKPDVSRAREILGWRPLVDLKEGLAPTIEWFAAQQPAEGPVVQAAVGG
ncbi:UDP-glucose 4-epimerase [Jannaschia seosinensis]|uniref:UDP-glucose 4-epimerase n=1 Tax=Jannaschia seosinensis TaxID=313367 RepID=A0A0M7B5R9_9RHOB|nr:UDP-glucuronic acid decarboxylase family protein [Jannaschia seosinensis]CUH13270.1 UDP-glucose 4-epimerase [Jannaschia seosinensis]